MARISVAIVTARPGGFDVATTGLSRQTFEDFEVVVVDAHWAHRHQQLADRFRDFRIPLTHVPPRLQNFPTDSVPQYRNTAVAKSRGELILWTVDYSYLPPHCLEAHWRAWEASGGTVCGMGAHTYLMPPTLAFPLPPYAPYKDKPRSGLETYLYKRQAALDFDADLRSGKYQEYWWSIFAEPLEDPFQINELPEDPYFWKADPKLDYAVENGIDGNYFHAKNESVRRDWMVAVNGFDETYTSHNYDDTDCGHRLMHVGAKWQRLPTRADLSIVNPRHVFPHAVRQVEDIATHKPMYEKRQVDTTMKLASNPYDLLDYEEVRWWYR